MIHQLLYNLPLDKMTPEGTLFWSGSKKPPAPLVFDVHDSEQLEFIINSANLRAHTFGLPELKLEWNEIKEILLSVKVPSFR